MMSFRIISSLLALASVSAVKVSTNHEDNHGFTGHMNLRRRLDLADFSVPSAAINVDVVTDPTTWALNILYNYEGEDFTDAGDGNVASDVNEQYTVKFYDHATCTTELTGTSITHDNVASPIAMGTNAQTGDPVFRLPLAVNGDTVTTDAEVWFPEDANLSQFMFCAILEIKYAGILVNVVRTQVVLDVTTDENGDFTSYSKEVAVRGSDSLQVSTSVSLTYTVQVYPCDALANRYVVGEVPEIFPGKAVIFCCELAEGTVGASVGSIDSLTYDTNKLDENGVDLPAVQIIDSTGPLNSLTEVDCTIKPGVCVVQFIPMATYFDDVEPLIVEGQAGIAQGQTSSGGTTETAPATTTGGGRNLEQEEAEDATFAFQIPLSTRPPAQQVDEVLVDSSAASSRTLATTIVLGLGSVCVWLLL